MRHTASRFICSLRSLRIRILAFAHLALLLPFVLPADTFGPYTYTVSDGQPPSLTSTNLLGQFIHHQRTGRLSCHFHRP